MWLEFYSLLSLSDLIFNLAALFLLRENEVKLRWCRWTPAELLGLCVKFKCAGCAFVLQQHFNEMCCYDSVVAFFKNIHSVDLLLDESLCERAVGAHCRLCADLLNSAVQFVDVQTGLRAAGVHVFLSRCTETQLSRGGTTAFTQSTLLVLHGTQTQSTLSLLTYFCAHLSSTDTKRRTGVFTAKSCGISVQILISPAASIHFF